MGEVEAARDLDPEWLRSTSFVLVNKIALRVSGATSRLKAVLNYIAF
jgi:hypothetical protein